MKILLSSAILLFAAACPAIAIAEWSYTEKEDLMRGVTNRWAAIASKNDVTLKQPYSGTAQLGIQIRSMPETAGEDTLIVLSQGPIDCSIKHCVVSVKFDDAKVRTYRGRPMGSGLAGVIKLEDQADFVERLRAAKRAIVEVSIWRHGPEQFVFEPVGLVWK